MTTTKRRPGAPFMRDGALRWPCTRCGADFDSPVTKGLHLMHDGCKVRAVSAATGPRRTTPDWKLFEALLKRSAKAQRDQGLSLERRAAMTVPGTTHVVSSGLDFEGDLFGRRVGCEAKSCAEAAFPTGKVTDGQAKRLRKAWERGVPAFVALEMRAAGKTFAVPWPLLARFRGSEYDTHRAIPLAVLEAEAIAIGNQPGRAVRLDLVAACRAVAALRDQEVVP